MEKRFVFSDNEVLTDASIDMNNLHGGTLNKTIVASEDYIFVGSRFPFNSFYLDINQGNENSGTISVEYWDGDRWRSCVEVLDETNGFSQSGHIVFTPNRDYLWNRDHTNYNNEQVLGLEDVVIYDKCWARISISSDTTATIFNWVGDIFATDDDIYSEFPEFSLTNTKTSFESGKTNWFEQIRLASKLVVDELALKNIIIGSEQILNYRDYTLACVSKVAEIIFGSFGDDYIEQRVQARNEFQRRITKSRHKVDLNGDAIESMHEVVNKTGFMGR